MRRYKWFCGFVLTATILTPTLAQAQAFDGNETAGNQADKVCSRLPTIVNGGSSQFEIDRYFNKPEAEWTNQDLSRLSSDYSTCYDSSTFDFGQRPITRSEFPAIVRNIVASADRFRQAAKVVQVEKSSFSPECQFVIDEILSDGSSTLEYHIPFRIISDLFKNGNHDEACDIASSYSAKLRAKRDLSTQCYEHAKAINAPTFKPEWFSTLAQSDDKTESILDADISFYKCAR